MNTEVLYGVIARGNNRYDSTHRSPSPLFATKGLYDTPIYSSPDASLSQVMFGRVQYGRADRTTTVLRNLMACTEFAPCGYG